MKRLTLVITLAALAVSCNNDLTFTSKSFHAKSKEACVKDCPKADVTVPIAEGEPIVADSINKKVFKVMKEIIFVGENPYTDKDYPGLLHSFIKSYEELEHDSGERFGWEATVDGSVLFDTDSIIDIELKHYTFTGGAHGYTGKRSLLFDPSTGKAILEKDLFKDEAGFKVVAEKEFRKSFKIPDGPINGTGLMFEEEKFQLPQTYFFTPKGLLLYYNVYEIASYADGPKELLIPYDKIRKFLAVRQTS